MRTASTVGINKLLVSLSCCMALGQVPAWSQQSNALVPPPEPAGSSPPAVALPAPAQAPSPAVTPAQIDNSVQSPGDPLAVAPALTGQLVSDALTGTASLSGRAVRVSISNTGARAMVIDGDAAWLDTGSQQKGKRRTGSRSLDELVSPPKRTDVPGDFVVTAAAIGSFGAAPIAADLVHKAQASGTAYYGKDQVRRQTAARILGERVIFPGDTTEGDVILDGSARAGQQLVVPIKSHPDGVSLGELKLDIKKP